MFAKPANQPLAGEHLCLQSPQTNLLWVNIYVCRARKPTSCGRTFMFAEPANQPLVGELLSLQSPQTNPCRRTFMFAEPANQPFVGEHLCLQSQQTNLLWANIYVCETCKPN
ncbi:hypothetical protein C2869_10185 [Saccharobesus litoralis]|uniref:Uncharacterized protein n=1 Tax=Saccharobesus litoralis TaxID=2172099 RepID=A0A2S0VRC9_9ALTE|nr:hypothetical protein C2869_10185 [Saccharobesus litoralis]